MDGGPTIRLAVNLRNALCAAHPPGSIRDTKNQVNRIARNGWWSGTGPSWPHHEIFPRMALTCSETVHIPDTVAQWSERIIFYGKNILGTLWAQAEQGRIAPLRFAGAEHIIMSV